MRQHITPEQLNEPSENGKEKLREWWKPKDGDQMIILNNPIHTFCFFPHIRGRGKKEEYLPLLSIGQMIEFLDEHNIHGAFGDDYFNADHKVGPLQTMNEETYQGRGVGIFWYGDELCDALWEAVKEVLEK